METSDFQTTEERIAELVASGLLPEEAEEIVERQNAARLSHSDL